MRQRKQASPVAIGAARAADRAAEIARGPKQFKPGHGPMAIDPQAFFAFWDPPEPKRPFELQGDTAIVSIDGPLCTKPDPWGFWDSYPEIVARVEAAFGSDARRVVLNIDSPGGAVHGCFEAARKLRALADEAKKPFLTEVRSSAMSAGYALACAGDSIACSETAVLGSVGVITSWLSFYRHDQEEGFDVAVISSGARKTDAHPAVPISDEAKAAQQAQVDELAKVFFAWVSERRGIPEMQVRALEANTFVGATAVVQRLADRLIGAGETLRAEKEPNVEEDEVMDALRSLAEGGNEKAKAALKAIEDESEEPAAEDAPAEDDKEEIAETAEETEESAEEEEEEPKAAAPVATAQAAAPAPVADDRFAKLEANQVRLEKEHLLSARSSVTAELRAAVMRPDVGVDAAKAMLAAVPKAPKPKPAAALGAQPTRGAQPGVTPAAGPTRASADADELDRKMGLIKPEKSAVQMDGTRQIISMVGRAPRGKVGANG